MLVPLAPSQRRAHDRAGSRTRGRRAARWAIQVLLIAGALLAIGTPALAATHPGRTKPPPGHPHRRGHAGRARRRLPGAGHRRHRRAGRAVRERLERDPRRPEQHLRALAAPARAGHRRHRRDGGAAGRGRGREDAVRQLRGGRPVLGRPWPAVLRHDVADRQQRGRDGLRRGQIHRPGDDHRLPVRGGQQHPDLAAERRGQADQRAGQRDLLPLPGAGRHPRRDVAGLAGPDPQARHPDHRGHAVDGGGRHRRHRADRPARRLHRRRDHRVQRRHRRAQHRVRPAARAGQQQLPAGHPGGPAERGGQLRVHQRQRPGGRERQRAVVGPGLQAVAVRGTRHHPVQPARAAARRPWWTPTAGSCCGRRRSRPTRPRPRR